MLNPIPEFKNIIVQIFRMFRVKRSEALPALVALAIYVALNAMVIAHYADKFLKPTKGAWTLFVKGFGVSGFDPLTYVVITNWDMAYNIYRHPLLAIFVYPLSVVDGWLMQTLHINCAMLIVAVVLFFLVFYSYIFMMRICRDIVGLNNVDAIILASMLFGFGYVMLSFIVPDHFGPSMFMLLMAIYVCGVKLRDGKRLDGWQTMLMFLFTAGITLSNGIKIFIDALFVDGKRFFRPRYMLCAILIPSAIIWSFARWEYRNYRLPKERHRYEVKKKKAEEKEAREFALFRDTCGVKDSVLAHQAFDTLLAQRKAMQRIDEEKRAEKSHKGKPIANGEFSSWTDISTPRWDSAVENLFGESIQIHPDYLLGDTLRGRPVIVRYNSWHNYAVELVIVLLFVAGIWMGRRQKFLWMVMCGFGFDMFIHVVLGFGLNEVYIMGAHWLFAMPIAMAYLLKNVSGKQLFALRSLLVALTVYLVIWNVSLIAQYFIWL